MFKVRTNPRASKGHFKSLQYDKDATVGAFIFCPL